MKFRDLAIFGFVSLGLLAVLFGPAMVGRHLIAPLDIAPALFSKYRWADPDQSPAPRNHYIIDQLTYDLPLQREIHQAVNAGRLPWWTFGDLAGRPLLADAHINGTDPIRLALYRILPFELAYNWTLLTHSLMAGLAAFALLRTLGTHPTHSVLLGLAWQFSGPMTLYVGHPWIQATFLHYPLLWIAWNRIRVGDNRRGIGWGAVLCALALNSGNLQSHLYLPLFAAAWLAGTCAKDLRCWTRLAPAVGTTVALGALATLPLLWSQADLYLKAPRLPETPFRPMHILAGAASLSGFFPWALGTFRTVDASKLFGQSALGFHLFIGIPFLLVVAASLFRQLRCEADSISSSSRRIAMILAGGYLIAVSTPAISFLYTRVAPLAALGLIVLAAPMLPAAERWFLPRTGKLLAGVAGGATISILLVSLVLLPRLTPKVEAYLLSRESVNRSMDESPGLRRAQADRMAAELSLRNPEITLALIGIGAAGLFLLTPLNRRPKHSALWIWVIGLAPAIVFHARFVPSHDVARWQVLLGGGPDQRLAQTLPSIGTLRISDEPDGLHDKLFPNCLGHLYGVQTLHGYAALRPPSISGNHLSVAGSEGEPTLADARYLAPHKGATNGEIIRLGNDDGSSRFLLPDLAWSRAPISNIVSSVNALEIQFASPSKDPFQLAWTDTYDPGWSATADDTPINCRPYRNIFTVMEIPPETRTVTFRYVPARFQPTWLGIAGCAWLVSLALIALGRRSLPRSS